MSVGKRLSTDQPLTEHDIAERLDKAALRTYRILAETREMGLADAVKHSRYFTNIASALAAELAAWGIEPVPLRASRQTSIE